MTQPPQWPEQPGPPPGDQPPPLAPSPAGGGIPTQPLYPGAAYGSPPGSPPGYGYQPYPAPPRTNGMAIASMVVSIVGIAGLCAYGLGGFIGAVGAILGHVARRQVRERGEGGDGMALAGIIVGWIAVGLAVITVAGFALFFIFMMSMEEFAEPSSGF